MSTHANTRPPTRNLWADGRVGVGPTSSRQPTISLLGAAGGWVRLTTNHPAIPFGWVLVVESPLYCPTPTHARPQETCGLMGVWAWGQPPAASPQFHCWARLVVG